MANLLEISEAAHQQVFPKEGDESAIDKVIFLSIAKTKYAELMWLKARNEKNEEGVWNVPSEILVESEPLPVVNNEIDISGLPIMKSIPQEKWLQNLGGLTCGCVYVKSNINQTQLLCDDDSLPEDAKTYLIINDKIKLPRGAHAKKLPIIFASRGERIRDNINIDDAIASQISDYLIQRFLGKIAPEDVTNNTNSDK